MQIIGIVGNVSGKNILLLQGLMGKFFNLLDHKFMRFGATTFRIGLNAGHFTPFKGRIEGWKNFIDKIFVFGDYRFYQSRAIKVVKKQGVELLVFEEAYVRPDFITLEKNAVNENFFLPRERKFYDALEYHGKMECNFKNILHKQYYFVALQTYGDFIVKVLSSLFHKFRCYFIQKTQVNGSFYKLDL